MADGSNSSDLLDNISLTSRTERPLMSSQEETEMELMSSLTTNTMVLTKNGKSCTSTKSQLASVMVDMVAEAGLLAEADHGPQEVDMVAEAGQLAEADPGPLEVDMVAEAGLLAEADPGPLVEDTAADGDMEVEHSISNPC